jgi:hypothetical protein
MEICARSAVVFRNDLDDYENFQNGVVKFFPGVEGQGLD